MNNKYTEVACVSLGNLSHWKGQKEDGNCYLGVLPVPFSNWIKLYIKSNEPDSLSDIWIKVEDQLPEVGQWVNVLVDNQDGDFWDKQKNPRFVVHGAQLREIDNEGYADWQRWVMSDGGPMGSLRNVTHWKPYPLPPKE